MSIHKHSLQQEKKSNFCFGRVDDAAGETGGYGIKAYREADGVLPSFGKKNTRLQKQKGLKSCTKLGAAKIKRANKYR